MMKIPEAQKGFPKFCADLGSEKLCAERSPRPSHCKNALVMRSPGSPIRAGLENKQMVMRLSLTLRLAGGASTHLRIIYWPVS